MVPFIPYSLGRQCSGERNCPPSESTANCLTKLVRPDSDLPLVKRYYFYCLVVKFKFRVFELPAKTKLLFSALRSSVRSSYCTYKDNSHSERLLCVFLSLLRFIAYRIWESKDREEPNVSLKLLDRLEGRSLGAVVEENAQVYEVKEIFIWASLTWGVWEQLASEGAWRKMPRLDFQI